jgi:hypothetical protein
MQYYPAHHRLRAHIPSVKLSMPSARELNEGSSLDPPDAVLMLRASVVFGDISGTVSMTAVIINAPSWQVSWYFERGVDKIKMIYHPGRYGYIRWDALASQLPKNIPSLKRRNNSCRTKSWIIFPTRCEISDRDRRNKNIPTSPALKAHRRSNAKEAKLI